nr:hypothetical protein [Halomicroarcula amylolytica]
MTDSQGSFLSVEVFDVEAPCCPNSYSRYPQQSNHCVISTGVFELSKVVQYNLSHFLVKTPVSCLSFCLRETDTLCKPPWGCFDRLGKSNILPKDTKLRTKGVTIHFVSTVDAKLVHIPPIQFRDCDYVILVAPLHESFNDVAVALTGSISQVCLTFRQIKFENFRWFETV